ncbi:MAG: bifunctional demethylmenaquinone methyltransferase/2-methoxy-6-polyprenyl-1,4-benzoquinol methylase UbiE [Gaiellales bacterium]
MSSDNLPVRYGVDEGTLPPERVQAMFDRIARPYDAMNRIMTAGLDVRWRKLAADATEVGAGASVLDCCCGTADLSLELGRRVGPSGEVVGIDFSEGMLERGRRKVARKGLDQVTLLHGDALDLPFEDDRFAAATVAFGIRNVADLDRGLRELVRVVRPGGKVVCLEITTPESGAAARFHRLWFDRLVPGVGKAVDRRGDSAYTYLPASVKRFPGPTSLAHTMYEAGLDDVRFRPLGGGIVALHVGTVAGERA